MNSGFVRVYPYFGDKKTKTLYQLSDYYTMFYYKFIKNNDQNGAQIDCGLTIPANPQNERVKTSSKACLDRSYMIIDRDDCIINLCEMKFSIDEYEIDKEYQQKLIKKIETFRSETKTKKNLQLTFVTTYGLKKNMYFGKVQRQIILDDLFEK